MIIDADNILKYSLGWSIWQTCKYIFHDFPISINYEYDRSSYGHHICVGYWCKNDELKCTTDVRKVRRQERDYFTQRPQRGTSFSFFKSKGSILQVVKWKRIRQSANDKMMRKENHLANNLLTLFFPTRILIMKTRNQQNN